MEERLKILVVDDDVVDRIAVLRALNAAGLSVELSEAENCSGAIAVLSEQSFDGIFLDYRLPDADGLVLLGQLRSAGFKIPIVVLTGQGDEEIAVQMMKAGASDYLSKTKLSPDALSRSLRNAIRIYRAEREAEIAQEKLKISEERYRLVLEGSNDAIWDWDLLKNEIFWNDRLREIIGFSEQEFGTEGSKLGSTWETFSELLHPEDRLKIQNAILAHLCDQTEFNLEFRLRHKSGKYRYCMTRGKAQRDAQGRPVRMAGIISDMTATKVVQEELSYRFEQLQIIYQITEAVSRAAKLEEIYQIALNGLQLALKADRTSVLLFDSDGVLRFKAWRRLSQEYRQRVEGHSPWSSETINPQPISIGDVEIEPSLAELRSVIVGEGIRALGFIPLVTPEKLLGKFMVYYDAPHQFSQEEMQLAQTIASNVAFALERKLAEEESHKASDNLRRAIAILGEQQQQLRTLQRLTNLLNQRLANLPDLLEVMVEAVYEAIGGAQFCMITLHNAQCDRLLLTVTAGIGTEKLRPEDALLDGKGWLNQVVCTGSSLAIGNSLLARDGGMLRQSGEREINDLNEGSDFPASGFAVPIESAQAGRLGVLAIGNWEDPEAFDSEDRHLLIAVGEQAAIAINNARLIKTLEDREERLELQNKMLASQNEELENQRHQIHLQNLQLLEAARLKSHFLATVSHELRTPMNAIIGFSQLLLRQLKTDTSFKVMPEQENMVERILNNGKHLLTLINDILDISKIEAGRMELEQEEINLPNLVINTTEELRSLAEEKNLELQVIADLKSPVVVNDTARLRQILINLLSNAIKFTNAGKVQVEAWELPNERVALAVSDTGIGIAAEHLEYIFEEFRQVDQSTTKLHYGTGLGLAIIKSLVHLMKGTITVKSNLGIGSHFRVEIPRILPGANKEIQMKKPRRLIK